MNRVLNNKIKCSRQLRKNITINTVNIFKNDNLHYFKYS